MARWCRDTRRNRGEHPILAQGPAFDISDSIDEYSAALRHFPVENVHLDRQPLKDLPDQCWRAYMVMGPLEHRPRLGTSCDPGPDVGVIDEGSERPLVGGPSMVDACPGHGFGHIARKNGGDEAGQRASSTYRPAGCTGLPGSLRQPALHSAQVLEVIARLDG